MSSARRWGCSIWAKWPPRGMSVQWRRSYLRATVAAGHVHHLVGEGGHPGRALDPHRSRRRRGSGPVGPVPLHRGPDGAGEPVDAGVGQHLVDGERSGELPVAVAPRPPLLDDPRQEPDGGVVQPEAERLGAGALDRHVAPFVVDVAPHLGQPGPVLVGGGIGREATGKREVDAGGDVGVAGAEARAHERAAVAAVGAEPLEPVDIDHERPHHVGAVVGPERRVTWGARVPVAGQ